MITAQARGLVIGAEAFVIAGPAAAPGGPGQGPLNYPPVRQSNDVNKQRQFPEFWVPPNCLVPLASHRNGLGVALVRAALCGTVHAKGEARLI